MAIFGLIMAIYGSNERAFILWILRPEILFSDFPYSEIFISKSLLAEIFFSEVLKAENSVSQKWEI